jgi:hypothetical protein
MLDVEPWVKKATPAPGLDQGSARCQQPAQNETADLIRSNKGTTTRTTTSTIRGVRITPPFTRLIVLVLAVDLECFAACRARTSTSTITSTIEEFAFPNRPRPRRRGRPRLLRRLQSTMGIPIGGVRQPDTKQRWTSHSQIERQRAASSHQRSSRNPGPPDPLAFWRWYSTQVASAHFSSEIAMREILPGIFTWGSTYAFRRWDLNGYAIRLEGCTVLVDPPASRLRKSSSPVVTTFGATSCFGRVAALALSRARLR